MARNAEFFLNRNGGIIQGTREGNYKLEKSLGEGGFGVALKATQPKSEIPVVIKISREDANPLAIAAFYQEAIALSHLTHPNIVAFHKVDLEEIKVTPDQGKQTSEYYPFLVMTYANHRSEERRVGKDDSYNCT